MTEPGTYLICAIERWAVRGERRHESVNGSTESRIDYVVATWQEDMRSTLSSPSPDVRFHGDKHGGARGSFEMRFDNVGEAQGWNVAHPRGQKPEPRYFVRPLPAGGIVVQHHMNFCF